MIDTILRQATRIPLRLRRHACHTRLGQQQSLQRGAGLEFDQIKEYLYGDTVRRINWAATARRGGAPLLMNVYYEEKDFTVMLLVDLSASMDFGSSRLTKKALAAEICASLVYSALVTHNRVGFCGFTSRVVSYFPPGQSPSYQRAIPEQILEYAPEPTPVDFWGVATTLERCVPPPVLVFLLSDFLTNDLQQLEAALTRLSRRHEIVALHVRDPLEITFPRSPARIITQDLETNRVQAYSLTRKNQQRMAEQAQARSAQLQALFQRVGIAHLTVTPQSNYRDDLSHIFLSSHRRTRT